MKKTTRKKLIEWTITAFLVALLAVVVWYRFIRPPSQGPESGPTGAPEWIELSPVATVEVVSEQDDIERGLMGRDSLASDSGMYFLYEDSGVRTFWMRNTRIPLSIAFIKADSTIAVIKDMEPFDTRYTSSAQEVKDALEMSRGWFHENDIQVGDRTKLHDDGTVHFSRQSR